MTPSTAEHNTPWYRQFWPWFLLALPAAALVAGSITLVIAIRHADQEIDANYVKHGLIIEAVQPQNAPPERPQ